MSTGLDTPVLIISTGRQQPPSDPERPVADDFEDGAPRCGICGEKKVKLPTRTTYNQLEVWVCDNYPDAKSKYASRRFGAPVSCDGDALKYAIWEWKDRQ